MKIDKVLLDKALAVEFKSDAGTGTIRDYFYTMLTKLWEEGEGFSGKRPFGNSGWECELAYPLIKAKIIKGYIDEYGDCDGYHSSDLYDIIQHCIHYIMYNEVLNDN